MEIHLYNRRIKYLIFGILFLISLIIFYFDYYYLGNDISIVLPYLIIVISSVWFIGNKTGFFFVLLSVFLWYLSKSSIGFVHNSILVIDLIIKTFFIFVQYFIIVKLKYLYHEVHKLSLVDELTKLHNRRGFYHLLKYELLNTRRDFEYYSLVYIDIDNFKKENDTKGHGEGDKILISFSKTLNQNLRVSDITARLGGDEFCIFVSRAEQSILKNIIERVVWDFRKVCKENSWNTTLSIGAFTTNHLFEIDDLLKRSDRLMYKAKSLGKNRTEYEIY